MAYLKKCQNSRIVYSTASNPESSSSPQAFTSVGIDDFNNPYSVNEDTHRHKPKTKLGFNAYDVPNSDQNEGLFIIF